MGKKQIMIMGLVVFVAASITTFCSLQKSGHEAASLAITEADLGKICVASVFPTITRGAQRDEPAGSQAGDLTPSEDGSGVKTEEIEQPVSETGEQSMEEENVPEIIDTEEQKQNMDNTKPLVILCHTHATESYQPVNEGNFHTLQETGSVREVGTVLANELEALGISVIHDKTIHDHPSYNQSYSRSLDTAKALMGKYPSAIFVIDLHRDAASYMGNVGQTVLVNGETVAKYSLVIGQGNPNVNALTSFAQAINSKAENMYSGFGGKIIEKSYKFNQHISDYYILLEIGNNENNIKEAKATAKYFAQVFASVVEDII